MTTATFERVRSIVADLFDLAPEAVTLETGPADVKAWDSLQQLNLVLAIEQEFAMQLEPEDMAQMTSVQAIVVLVDRRQV